MEWLNMMYVHANMYVCMYVCVCVYVCVRVRACMHVCMYVGMHTRTNTSETLLKLSHMSLIWSLQKQKHQATLVA
jgi:hypothetical protein